jgi:membrane protein YdbS with pleckstrin-like domain
MTHDPDAESRLDPRSADAGDTWGAAPRALDPRVVRVWRIGHAVGFAIMFLLLLAGVVPAGLASPMWGGVAALAWLVAAGIAAWFVVWHPPRAYRAWWFRVDARVLETHRGVAFEVTQLLPLSRLQHVDLHRGPVERAFGLASLVLHTAGTREPAIRIPGLEAGEAVRLRDHLVAVGGDDAV